MQKFIAFLVFVSVTGFRLPAQAVKSTPIHTTSSTGFAWAPTYDGRRIYFVRDTQLVMFDRATGTEIALTPMHATNLTVNRLGDRLGFSRRSEDGRTVNAWTVGVDRSSGRVTGSPIRLSMMDVTYAPEFSPDGKTVALVKARSVIAVAPVNGGPERVLLRTKADPWPVRWAPDGKALYAALTFDHEIASEQNGIYRIPLDNSPPRLIARAADWGGYPGSSLDGRYLVFWDRTWDTVIVQTIDGRRIAALDESGQFENWIDGYRGIVTNGSRPRALNLRLTSPERTIALPDTFLNPPVESAWSPDGKLVAVVGRTPNRIVVYGSDGKIVRRSEVSATANATRGIKWSPDGQRLMYAVPASGIHIIDMTTGAESHLPTGGGSRPAWRSDSRGVLYSKLAGEIGPDSLTPVSIREMELDGRERTLRTVRVMCRPADCDIKMVNDSVGVTWRDNEYYLIPIRHSGEPRLVYTRPGTGQPVPTFSSNGQWMAVRVAVQGERLPRHVDVMRIDGSARRTVELDLMTLSGPDNPVISDDGRELLVLGTKNGGFEVHRVDVTTGRSTRVTGVRIDDRSGIKPTGISPDGRALFFHSPLPSYTKFVEIDLSEIVRGRR